MRLKLTKKTIVVLLVGSFVFGGALGLMSRFLRSRGNVAAPVVPAQRERVRVPFEVAEPILDRKLAAGWQDWGWGHHELDAAGSPRLAFAGYGGIAFRHGELGRHFGALTFRFRAPESFGDFLEVALKYEQVGETVLPKVRVDRSMTASLADGWKEVLIPWSLLNPTNSPVDR